jgi:hypothetical protein
MEMQMAPSFEPSSVLVVAHRLYAFVCPPPFSASKWVAIVAVIGGLMLQALVVLWPAAQPV